MYADDRVPTLEEIHKIIKYPDRRMKPIVYTDPDSELCIIFLFTG
jgi:hypothetical protein